MYLLKILFVHGGCTRPFLRFLDYKINTEKRGRGIVYFLNFFNYEYPFFFN